MKPNNLPEKKDNSIFIIHFKLTPKHSSREAGMTKKLDLFSLFVNLTSFFSVCAFNCLYFSFIHIKGIKSRSVHTPSEDLIGHDAVVGGHGDLLGTDDAVLKRGGSRWTVIWQ